MSRLVQKLFLLALLAVVSITAVVAATSFHSDHYMAAAQDKYDLLHATKPPRMILVGGSNLAFSVDSEKIETRFGVPVINMGLHAGVGLKFMLNQIQPVLNQGDIVIIFPEYEQFYSLPLNGRPGELGAVAKFCNSCISALVPQEQYPIVIQGIFYNIEPDLLSLLAPVNDVYSRHGFNRWGDMTAHLNQKDRGDLSNRIVPVEIVAPNPAVEFLNEFYTSNADVRMYVMFPAIPADEYENQKKEFSALQGFLADTLKIPVLGTPQDFLYPRKFFFDTVYHMTALGREKRTERIVELLQAEFEKGK